MCIETEDELAARIQRKMDEHKRQHQARVKEWEKSQCKRGPWVTVPLDEIKAIKPDAYTATFLFLQWKEKVSPGETGKRGFSYVECERYFGVNHQAAYRALQRLETKGLITVEWWEGAKPRVALIESLMPSRSTRSTRSSRSEGLPSS